MTTVPSFALTDRVALVTGAGGGIGAATALALAAAGAAVAATDLDEAAAGRTAAAVAAAGGRACAWRLDVTAEAEAGPVVAAAVERFGRLDILVNNAGIGARQAAAEMPTEVFERVAAVNLVGAFRCAREASRPMIAARRGAVINVASIMGLVGGSLYPNPAYHASKGGLVNLTRALALEWAPYGIRVNAVAPAFVRTALTARLLADGAMAAAILAATPLGRLVEPEEVAAAILFLASDAAAMVTGVTLPVDGGWLAR
jgi:NAD(P)-dependent dehydrogenase (short-subunit alcohol dehydrogenase family)